MQKDWVEIFRSFDVHSAQMLKAFLESNGMEVLISGDHLAVIRPLEFTNDPVRLFVAPADLRSAQTMVAEYQKSDAPVDKTAPSSIHHEIRSIQWLTLFGLFVPILPSLLAIARTLHLKNKRPNELPKRFANQIIFWNIVLIAVVGTVLILLFR